MSGYVNGNRLRMAREMSRLSREAVAAKIETTPDTLRLIEVGQAQPSVMLLDKLGFALGFPVSFFRRGDPPDMPLGSLLFHQTVIACDLCDEDIRYPDEPYKCACGKDICLLCSEEHKGNIICKVCARQADEERKRS